MKENILAKVEKHFEKALQGIAFWMSYSKMYFNNHKIQEGAITHEFCKLLQSNISNHHLVFQEEMIRKNLLNEKSQERVDIVIQDENEKITHAIEVKRDVNSTTINKDIEKLINLKIALPEIICYLLIVSEKNLINRYINENGNAKRKLFSTKEVNIKYKVRRVCKSSASFKETKIKSANYAILIEILTK
ncbi:MAG: hypothetical protein ACOYLE_03230 [Bacteroidales bacterium]